MVERPSRKEQQQIREQHRIKQRHDRKAREAAEKQAVLELSRQERRAACDPTIERRRVENKLAEYYKMAAEFLGGSTQPAT